MDIERSIKNKLGSPYTDCIKNVDSPKAFTSYFYKSIFTVLKQKKYRQKMCTKLCLQEYIYQFCHCLDGSLPNIYSINNVISICNTITLLNCTANARNLYYNDGVSSSCKQCPKECQTIMFDVEAQTVSRYPSSYYSQFLWERTNIPYHYLDSNSSEDLNNIPYHYLNSTSSVDLTKSTLMANIFFDELEIEHLNEIPLVSFNGFLSNIGGNIGIYAGMSLMGFPKVVEFIIQSLNLYLNHREQLKKKNLIFDKLKQKKSKIYIANTNV